MPKYTTNALFAAAAMSLSVLAGCQTDPYKTAAKTDLSLADNKQELLMDKNTLKMTTDDLNDLIYHPAGDLRPQYEKYSSDVAALDKSVAASRKSAKGMTMNREAYLAQWRSQTASIQDTDIRMRAMDRINETEKHFSVLTEKLMAADDSIEPVVSELKSIDTYLSGDLTAGGIKLISDRASGVKSKTETVDMKIDDAVRELDKVSDQITPTTNPAGSTSSTPPAM